MKTLWVLQLHLKNVFDALISDKKGNDKKSYRISNFFKDEQNAFSSKARKMMEYSMGFDILFKEK